MLKEHCTLYRLTTQRFTGALSYSPPLTPTSSTVAPGASTTLVPNAADSQRQQRRMLLSHHCRSHWEAVALPPGNSGRRPTNVLCCRHATVNGRERNLQLVIHLGYALWAVNSPWQSHASIAHRTGHHKGGRDAPGCSHRIRCNRARHDHRSRRRRM